VQRFLAGLADHLSGASVVKVHGVLRVALSDAERFGLVSRNVAKLVRPPTVAAPERRSLTLEEARRFLSVVRSDRLEGVFVLGLALGLRRGELLGLRWDDVDLPARTLTVARALQRADGELRIVQPKTQRSRRVLPLPEVVVAALERQRARQAAERLRAPCWRDEGLVFASTVGTPLEPPTSTGGSRSSVGRPNCRGCGSMTSGTAARRSCSHRASSRGR
jgi:integrase